MKYEFLKETLQAHIAYAAARPYMSHPVPVSVSCAELADMLADVENAGRYRWLRDTATTGRAVQLVQLVQWMPGEMDAKIDAEMAPRRVG